MQETQPQPALAIVKVSPLLRWGLLAAVALTVVLAYWPILFNGFVDFDDNAYITVNTQVRKGLTLETIGWAFTSINVSNWHPLTMLSHLLDVTLFGLQPMGHHAVSLVLAAINAVLLVVVLERLTGSFYRSLCVGLIFAAHPIHVESIAWAASRKDLLSVFFVLLAINAYVKWTARPTPRGYALLLLLFVLALMSKPTVITLPAVLLLLDFWPLKRTGVEEGADFDAAVKAYVRAFPRLVKEKLGLLAVSALFSVVVFLAQRTGGAVVEVEAMPLHARLLNAVVSYARYLKKMILPDDLVFLYHHPVWWPAWIVILSAVLLVALTLAVAAVARKTDRRYLPVGWLWFLGTMIPMIGLVQVGVQSMADRYAYFTFIGLYIIVVWATADLAVRWRLPRAAMGAGVAAVVLVLGVMANLQARHWYDSVTLFSHHLAVAGSHPHVENNLGVIYTRREQPDLAIEHFEKALALRSDSAEIYVNYAKALIKLNRLSEAQDAYQKAVELDPSQAIAWLRLGMIQAGMGRVSEAEKTYQQFAKARPDLAEPFYYLGQIHEHRGDLSQADSYYRQAIAANPRYLGAYESLGNLLAQNGDSVGANAVFAKAEPLLREAIAANPTDADAHNLLGTILAQKGDIAEAEKLFARAVELAPENQQAQGNLARARAILMGLPAAGGK
jgi:protein O-mannosyl-transferase